jgi:hypothetical protein
MNAGLSIKQSGNSVKQTDNSKTPNSQFPCVGKLDNYPSELIPGYRILRPSFFPHIQSTETLNTFVALKISDSSVVHIILIDPPDFRYQNILSEIKTLQNNHNPKLILPQLYENLPGGSIALLFDATSPFFLPQKKIVKSKFKEVTNKGFIEKTSSIDFFTALHQTIQFLAILAELSNQQITTQDSDARQFFFQANGQVSFHLPFSLFTCEQISLSRNQTSQNMSIEILREKLFTTQVPKDKFSAIYKAFSLPSYEEIAFELSTICKVPISKYGIIGFGREVPLISVVDTEFVKDDLKFTKPQKSKKVRNVKIVLLAAILFTIISWFISQNAELQFLLKDSKSTVPVQDEKKDNTELLSKKLKALLSLSDETLKTNTTKILPVIHEATQHEDLLLRAMASKLLFKLHLEAELLGMLSKEKNEKLYRYLKSGIERE